MKILAETTMFAGVCIGSSDLPAAGLFYDEVLGKLGMSRGAENESEIGYADASGSIDFWVLSPYNQLNATAGNGTQIMFKASNETKVDEFYHAALTMGGTDDGPPGLRNYHPGYYGAYCRDVDGNKLHVFYRP